jgi:hypothetical protein
MTLEAIIQEIQTLPVADRKYLVHVIVDTLIEAPEPENQTSLLELEGLGKEIWQNMDAQEYINTLRQEWDDRP